MNARAAALPDPYDEGMRLSAAGRHADAIAKFETALADAPNDFRVLFALGNTARALGMSGPAETFYRRVLALAPDRVEAHVNLANLLKSTGNSEGAEAVLAPALARNAQAPELWLTLGNVHREKGDDVGAERNYREALARNADYVPALANLADVMADRGEIDAALAQYDRVLKLDAGHAQARLNRAVLHLLCGNLADGWRDYAARLKVENKVPVADHRLARWSGGTLKRTRLLVTAEQGIGDQIMLASTIPDLLARAHKDGGSVVLECEPRLVPLFARSFPAATVKPWAIETRGGVAHSRYAWLNTAGGANAATEIGSLPRYLRRSLDAFPNPHRYLAADESEMQRWREWLGALGDGPRVGICWRSGNTAAHRALQYAPVEAWAEFLRHTEATFVSVQYDAGVEEIARLESLSGKKIHNPPGIDQKREIDRTCALLCALDAVIAAPTAVAWQAASLGVRTGKLLYDTSWTSFGKAIEPFAPACRCLSPAARGDWRDGFAQARALIAATA